VTTTPAKVSEAWRRSGRYLLASTTIETTLITGGRPQIPLFIRRFLVRIPGGGRGHPRSSPSTASTGACSEEKVGGAGTIPGTSRVALVPTTAPSPEYCVHASSTRPGHRQANIGTPAPHCCLKRRSDTLRPAPYAWQGREPSWSEHWVSWQSRVWSGSSFVGKLPITELTLLRRVRKAVRDERCQSR
jgi:hypothetical protein